MRVLQVAHAMTKDDGASRHMLNMDRIFRELGYETAMFSHKIDARIEAPIQPMDRFNGTSEDIVIYQMTSGTSFNKWVYQYPQKVVLYYHNITPAKYFWGNAWGSWYKCLKGRRDLKRIAANSFFGWGASEYSRQELAALGMKHTGVMPAVVEPAKYQQYAMVPELYERYHDGCVNILVVGRGVPHKKQDEAIEMVDYYRQHISDRVRLVIIGNMKPSFAKKLQAMVRERQLEKQVIFTGQISNEELCTWYRAADAVLCLSEHEGFCVPLVEGMIFGKPVFAYACAAVPETLGKAGILLPDKEPGRVAQTIHDTLADEELLARLAIARQERLRELSYSEILKQVAIDMKEIVSLWEEVRK